MSDQQTLKLMAWSHAKKALGAATIEVTCTPEQTPRDIIREHCPAVLEIDSCRVAIDECFHDWDTPIGLASDLAIIPPVSGG